jgi:spoIIIJ-associated protein
MEWVETTGKTIDEAKEAALDELGVDEQDAEFEILAEPKMGLFGRVRSEGRVRARVRPTTPRAKEDRRDRRRRNRAATSHDGEPTTAAPKAPAAKSTAAKATASSGTSSRAAAKRAGSRATALSVGTDTDDDTVVESTGEEDTSTEAGTGPARPRRNRRRRSGRGAGTSGAASGGADTTASPDGTVEDTPAPAEPAKKTGNRRRRPVETTTSSLRHLDDADDEAATEEGADMEVALEEQGGVATEFLHGLVERFGLTAAIDVSQPDEDTLNIQLSGGDLGLLIGPKGATLLSIQDLTRTVVQRKTGAGNGRIYVDISGYRQKRAEALARFTTKVASDVLAKQQRIALEPMSAPDRKVVHDTAAAIDGVSTLSEGEEPRRRVVIIPAES